MSIFRFILFPFSLIYGLIIGTRNALYNSHIFYSREHSVKLIVVGNLSMGGTGKSPVTMYLKSLLSERINVAILSRGYGRKTKGYKLVESVSQTCEVGDEPLMFKTIVGNEIPVVVCEDRNNGVDKIHQNFPKTEVIILDDAFQHRKIKAGFAILLTTFEKPFFSDYIVPSGGLRECRSGAKRADVILVTKCPKALSINQKNEFQKQLGKYNKPVFFSKVNYGQLINVTYEVQTINNVIIVVGIANPSDMIESLEKFYKVESFVFSDHHEFTRAEINKIHQKFDTFVPNETAIVTTQKDYMRLKDKVENWGLINYPWYILPISIEIENEQEFNKLILDYVGKN